MKTLTRFAVAAIIGSALSVTCWASLVGTSVTGNMNIGGTNYFDPAQGYVPAGYGNSSPGTTTVTIATPLVEFGFQDGANLDTADFTDSTLTLTDVSNSASIGITYSFTDSAFAGLTLTEISDTFPGGVGASLVGDTITLDAPALSSSGTYVASYDLGPAVPEPKSAGLAAGAFALFLLAVRMRWIKLPLGN